MTKEDLIKASIADLSSTGFSSSGILKVLGESAAAGISSDKQEQKPSLEKPVVSLDDQQTQFIPIIAGKDVKK